MRQYWRVSSRCKFLRYRTNYLEYRKRLLRATMRLMMVWVRRIGDFAAQNKKQGIRFFGANAERRVKNRTTDKSCRGLRRHINNRLQTQPGRDRQSLTLAEREGFEPPDPFGSTVFKTAAIDHSATSPFPPKRTYYIIFSSRAQD